MIIEGRWQNINRYIKQLEAQGWVVVTCEPNEEFTLTTVEIENGESIHIHEID